MAVKVSKLWSDNKFLRVANNSKLLYIYLATSPNIMTVGAISINLDLIKLQLGLSLEDIRNATTELRSTGYIEVQKIDDVLYFIVIEHFNTVAKSDSSVLKIKKELMALPVGLVKLLDSLNINTTRKVVVFNEPTPTEVMDYALELGYKVDAEEFISFYRNKA